MTDSRRSGTRGGGTSAGSPSCARCCSGAGTRWASTTRSQTPEDEYDSYARILLSRLSTGATAQDGADYLRSVEHDAMGLSFHDEAKLRSVGQRVVDWYDESISCWMDRSDEFD